jgi:hypothetical protein
MPPENGHRRAAVAWILVNARWNAIIGIAKNSGLNWSPLLRLTGWIV